MPLPTLLVDGFNRPIMQCGKLMVCDASIEKHYCERDSTGLGIGHAILTFGCGSATATFTGATRFGEDPGDDCACDIDSFNGAAITCPRDSDCQWTHDHFNPTTIIDCNVCPDPDTYRVAPKVIVTVGIVANLGDTDLFDVIVQCFLDRWSESYNGGAFSQIAFSDSGDWNSRVLTGYPDDVCQCIEDMEGETYSLSRVTSNNSGVFDMSSASCEVTFP